MIQQIVKVHNASELSTIFIDVGIILGILFCIIGLVMIIYTSKYYR